MAGKKKKETKEKPLDKMTAKELREIGKEIPDIVGVHGMNKAELIRVIKEARGIVEEKGTAKAKDKGTSVRNIKTQMKTLRVKREAALEAEDTKKAAILRRRIIRMKKKTRRAA
jgi:hypothetical protein